MMYYIKKLYARLFGSFIVRRERKKALKFIKSLPRDAQGRWIFPEDK